MGFWSVVAPISITSSSFKTSGGETGKAESATSHGPAAATAIVRATGGPHRVECREQFGGTAVVRHDG
ncbi:hypothetical protein RRSWK_03902 [Rhodopirellula sp. SWK7]|nr:hypothetical protein RRSWK_03902 [Rhodopirellula sp. SWK7]